MKIVNIRPPVEPTLLVFEAKPDKCEHAWELHLWEPDEAYCPRCGSLATLTAETKGRG